MWVLKIVEGAELADKLVPEVRLPQPLQRFVIGRDPANPWPIADRTRAISGRHFEIFDSPAGPALRDLSTNGTFINGATTRLQGEHLLRDGDRVAFGPFAICVSGPPMPVRPAAAEGSGVIVPTVAAAPPRAPAAAAALRGGDPAAMAALALAGGAAGKQGLTEILRVAAPSDRSDAELTKIQLAPVQPAAAPAGLASAPPSEAPAAPAPVPPSAILQALARGLGLPVSALAGHDALHLVQQLALTARTATATLQQLTEHQARSRRDVQALHSADPAPDADNPWRAGARPDAAVLALALAAADPAQAMQRAARDLCAHEDRLLQALAAASHHAPTLQEPSRNQES